MSPRFLTLDQVAEALAISKAQTYALVRRRELRALKIGGRGIWRVSTDDLDDYLARGYQNTEAWIREHPFTGDELERPEETADALEEET